MREGVGEVGLNGKEKKRAKEEETQLRIEKKHWREKEKE